MKNIDNELVKYFSDYPKCKLLAQEISKLLKENLSNEIVQKITKLADTFSFETPIKK